jgi:hypothetical protein
LRKVVLAASLAAAFLALFGAAPARAFEGYVGARPLGMGEGSRAWATGDAGPLLNPSGMSLLKTYTVDGGYAYGRTFSENLLHASIVDNTSSYGLAGGIYYTYHATAAPPDGASGYGHEGGLALSLPFGEMLALGATVKYFHLVNADAGAASPSHNGVTFDIGGTFRPAQALSLAVVGTNLHDLDNGLAPIGLGYGAALMPIPNLILVADGRTTFERDLFTGRKGTSIMGGGEWTLVDRMSLRAGGGYDASSGNGYLTAGLSGLSEIGALDFGLRQDVSQHQYSEGVAAPRQTIVGVNLRVFVPASQTQPPQ